MFRLSLHLGPLHLDVAIGNAPTPYEEGYPEDIEHPIPFTVECVNAFEVMAHEHAEWDES